MFTLFVWNRFLGHAVGIFDLLFLLYHWLIRAGCREKHNDLYLTQWVLYLHKVCGSGVYWRVSTLSEPFMPSPLTGKADHWAEEPGSRKEENF